MVRKRKLFNSRSLNTKALAKLLRLKFVSAVSLCTLCFTQAAVLTGRNTAYAQVVTSDQTTGTQVNSIPSNPSSGGGFIVTGGSSQQGNLFHSFETFSPENAFTVFDLTDERYSAINNIFSRVTGGTRSNLNSLLQVVGGNSPNLFLLNPTGISIGPSANLDIPGSFFATTGDRVLFKDGTIFAASGVETNVKPMLTVSAPTGIQFGETVSDLTVIGRYNIPSVLAFIPENIPPQAELLTYALQPATTLTLLGGDVTLTDAYFKVPSGSIQLGSVGANSVVAVDADTHALTYSDSMRSQDISLTRSVIDVSSADGGELGGGNLSLHGSDIKIIDGSGLLSTTRGAQNGGLVSIEATRQLDITQSIVSAAVSPVVTGRVLIPQGPPQPPSPPLPGQPFPLQPGQPIGYLPSTGRGSDLNVSIQHLYIGGLDTLVGTDTFSSGNGGDINIHATGDVTLVGAETPAVGGVGTRITATTIGEGTGGNLTIKADTIRVEDGSRIGADAFSSGDSGSVEVTANNLTLLSIPRDPQNAGGLLSTISTTVFRGTGNGGDLRLNVGQLSIQFGGQIGAGTFSEGNSGKLSVVAKTGIDISGFVFAEDQVGRDRVFPSGLFNTAEPDSSGNGGDVTVIAPRLHITEGGVLSVRGAGTGDAGSIKLNVSDILVADTVVDPFDGSVSGISAEISEVSSGSGGQLEIVSDRLRVYNGGQVTASTSGSGNAGSVDITSDLIDVRGFNADSGLRSRISSQSTTTAAAGSVTLTVDRISITDQGAVSVSNLMGGNAGNVMLNARTVSLNNGSVQAEASMGSQGNLIVDSDEVLLLRQGSTLTANATETATGGNITLSSPVIVGLENSDISANAVEGDGGNIQLVTDGLVGIALRDRPTAQSDITASSEFGISGTIDLESPDVDTDSGLVQLPDSLVDASDQVTAACAAQDGNQFASTGRGGLPNNPLQQLSSNRPWQDFRVIAQPLSFASDRINKSAAIEQLPAAANDLMEAGQWQLNTEGEVVLFAENVAPTPAADCL